MFGEERQNNFGYVKTVALMGAYLIGIHQRGVVYGIRNKYCGKPPLLRTTRQPEISSNK
jgi:hypothetical protein